MIEMQELEITYDPWMEFGQFDDRQRALIHNCRQYVTDGAPGLPGHQLMLIVAKMAALLDAATAPLSVAVEIEPDAD